MSSGKFRRPSNASRIFCEPRTPPDVEAKELGVLETSPDQLALPRPKTKEADC
jgi:hypothetical protein